jgi:hypothetical protein
MVVAAQGTVATVSATFTDGVGGPFIDAPNLQIAIGGGLNIGPTTAGIVHPSTGHYNYSWSVPANQAVASYPVTWTSDLGSLSDSISVISTVISPAGAWASPADVLNWTRIAVDDADVLAAQSVIDLYSETTINAYNNVRPRDRLRLKQAVVYQAAWMSSQPDLFTRAEIAGGGHAATSFSYTDPQSVSLAPLAKRALAQLSWKRTRTVRIRTVAGDGRYSLRQRWYDMEHDTGPYEGSDYWTPM